jgi:hypothetical protein
LYFILYRNVRDQNELRYDDTSLVFVRNIKQLIENQYPATNLIVEIRSSSCHLAGQILCSHLLKMLFEFYNVDPAVPEQQLITTETIPSIDIFELYLTINILKNVNLVQSTINKIRERIINIPSLFFVKRDLTGPMGLLRHYPTDMVNTVLDQLISHELIRQGCKRILIFFIIIIIMFSLNYFA